MRLTPREADAAALGHLARGRCTWPQCSVQIWALVDGRYVHDAVKAHIEAAEKDGPRWRASMTDEERRAPDNLMWLCQKHHSAIDAKPEKYTVEVLKRWKAEREAEVPELRRLEALTEERLEQVINASVDRLTRELADLDLPSGYVAEMLLVAGSSMPTSDTAEMLLMAGGRMPSADIAEMLWRAASRMPDEDTAASLLGAAKAFESAREQLDQVVDRLQAAAARPVPDPEFVVQATYARDWQPLFAWRAFGFGVVVAFIIVIVGVGVGVYFPTDEDRSVEH